MDIRTAPRRRLFRNGLAAIESVTKRDGEDYDVFVQRAALNPIGQRVKLADLNDDCDAVGSLGRQTSIFNASRNIIGPSTLWKELQRERVPFSALGELWFCRRRAIGRHAPVLVSARRSQR
jgi:hypothetical protein